MPPHEPSPPDQAGGSDTATALGTLERLSGELDLPGGAVAVVRRGRPTLVVCRGLADVAAERPWAPDTLTRLGSIAKTVTTAAAIRLVEGGAFSLDTAVRGLLPEPVTGPPGADPITVEHLLTHTSGIGELTSWQALRHPLWAIGGSWRGRPVPSLAQLLAHGVRAEVPPDTRWVYSNPAFSVLGRIVEMATGEPFERAVRSLVLEPAGLDDMHVGTADLDARRSAVGHRRTRRGFTAVTPYEVATVSAGGVVASVEGLAAWARLLLDGGTLDGSRVLDASAVADAFAEHRGIDPSLRSVGLTFWRSTRHGRLVVSHGGSMPGFSNGMRICPSADLAVVAVANRSVAPSPSPVRRAPRRDRPWCRRPPRRRPLRTPAERSAASADRRLGPPMARRPTRRTHGTRPRSGVGRPPRPAPPRRHRLPHHAGARPTLNAEAAATSH
jgi:CubicO group peptidase (beta-lactamase class C family)